MAKVTYDKELTVLLVIDPYNDFISGQWYPSNAGEQTSICHTLNQQSFFAIYSGQSLTWAALPLGVLTTIRGGDHTLCLWALRFHWCTHLCTARTLHPLCS
jgi:hypothetical protein